MKILSVNWVCVSEIPFRWRKAGDIIPEVIGVTRHELDAQPYQMPEFCPSCGAPAVHLEDEAALRCVNPECPAQALRNIIHFGIPGCHGHRWSGHYGRHAAGG